MTTLDEISSILGKHSWFNTNKSSLIYELNYVVGIPEIDNLIVNQNIKGISIILGERPLGFELFITTSNFKNYRFGFLYNKFSYWKIDNAFPKSNLVLSGTDIKNQNFTIYFNTKNRNLVESFMEKLPIRRLK